MQEFSLNTRIISGKDSLRQVGELKAKNVWIVTDENMVKFGLVSQLTSILKDSGMSYQIFDSVEANPSLETVKIGLHQLIEQKPEAIIAIGGGSVIDAAKAMLYFCIKTKEALIHKSPIAKPIFVAIPTTSGTGSEVTSYSVVTDTATHTKIPLTDPIMLPELAILDPLLTVSVPKGVTADTGMDVITHAIEAYVATSASIFSDLYALKAIELAFSNLLKVYLDGNNIAARQLMHEASCMAGMAFTNAGLGITHSLAHAVGGKFGISHGRANAILLPVVISYNSGLMDNSTDKHGHRYDTIAGLLGFQLKTAAERIGCLVELINRFNDQVGIPPSFKACGVDKSLYQLAIDELATKALKDICTTANPRPVSKEQLIQLLEKAYE